MTREEAIAVLENAKYELSNQVASKYCRKKYEAIDIAIKALEQEPTTKNDLGVDCIDRQATLDAIIKRLGIKNETYLLEAERVIYQQILAMPSVTPQEPFINKPCVSSGVCEHDKQKVLDKIRAEIEKWHEEGTNWSDIRLMNIEDILDKYKAESKPQESEDKE